MSTRADIEIKALCECGDPLGNHTVSRGGDSKEGPGPHADRGCDVPRCVCPWFVAAKDEVQP